MPQSSTPEPEQFEPEPRWLAWIVVLALAGIYTALPKHLIVGPRWAFIAVVVVLLVSTMFTHFQSYRKVDKILGFVELAIITAGMMASVAMLIQGLPAHLEQPAELLLSAAALWLTNVLVFALWYWKLDAGGPHGRERRGSHENGAFLFPQMTMPPSNGRKSSAAWKPNFIDYLFLAFNTSTAFSPTDVPVLTRWAKVLMMLQSLISLTVLALLAARAVNIL